MATVKKAAAAGGKRLTQSQVITSLADQSDLNKKVVKEVLTNLADLAIKETKKKGEFVFPGIGKLVRSDRKARMGRNPATGVPIKIPAKKVVKFRVSKAAKDAIVPPAKKK
jgi:DNA-binding protein HU-beta